MDGPSARGWEAVEGAETRVRDRATARQRAADRRERRRSWTVWALRVLLPVLGAAAVLLVLQRRDWSTIAAAAALAVPAVVSAWLARRDGVADTILWLLVTLAAELALVFAVGLALLGLGPA
jgi:hypothetical protein